MLTYNFPVYFLEFYNENAYMYWIRFLEKIQFKKNIATVNRGNQEKQVFQCCGTNNTFT